MLLVFCELLLSIVSVVHLIWLVKSSKKTLRICIIFLQGSSYLAQKHITLVMSKEQTKMHQYILESPVSTPLSNQQTCVHIELLFLIENLSYTYR